MAIVAEFGEPVAHLGPAVVLGHADVVLADLDLHVKPPVQPGISAEQGVTLLRDSNAAGQWTGRPLRVPGGPCCDRVVDCGPVGRCNELVPDMPAGSERTVSPWGVFATVVLGSSFQKRPGLLSSGFSVFTIPTSNNNQINLR